jgi:hypothetical protein
MLSTRSHSYEARVRSLSLIAQNWGMVTLASGDDDGRRGSDPGAASVVTR